MNRRHKCNHAIFLFQFDFLNAFQQLPRNQNPLRGHAYLNRFVHHQTLSQWRGSNRVSQNNGLENNGQLFVLPLVYSCVPIPPPCPATRATSPLPLSTRACPSRPHPAVCVTHRPTAASSFPSAVSFVPSAFSAPPANPIRVHPRHPFNPRFRQLPAPFALPSPPIRDPRSAFACTRQKRHHCRFGGVAVGDRAG